MDVRTAGGTGRPVPPRSSGLPCKCSDRDRCLALPPSLHRTQLSAPCRGIFAHYSCPLPGPNPSLQRLKPGQPVIDAVRDGLYSLDSRAVAALLKELSKSGQPQRASGEFGADSEPMLSPY